MWSLLNDRSLYLSFHWSNNTIQNGQWDVPKHQWHFEWSFKVINTRTSTYRTLAECEYLFSTPTVGNVRLCPFGRHCVDILEPYPMFTATIFPSIAHPLHLWLDHNNLFVACLRGSYLPLALLVWVVWEKVNQSLINSLSLNNIIYLLFYKQYFHICWIQTYLS